MQGIRIHLVAGARIDLGHDRIVPGDAAVGLAGEALDDFPAQAHVADIVDDRKRAAAMHVGVIMRSIRRQHHRSPRGFDPHHLQAVGMAADPMQRDAGRDLAVAGMERHPLAEDMAHHQRDMLHRKRMPQRPKTHAAPGGVAHLAILQMKSRVRKQIEIAGVVIMQMSDDDVLDRIGQYAEARQRLDRVERQLAVSQLRLCRIEAGIDQDIAAVAPDQPDEVIEVLRGGLMRIRQQKIQLRRARRHRRIADGIDCVDVSHRYHFSWLQDFFDVGTKPSRSAKVKRLRAGSGCMEIILGRIRPTI